MNGIEKFLMKCESIIDKYKFAAKLTGERFNIFEILNLQTNEVRLHSSLIAELLDINGPHLQGDKFLKLFLKNINFIDISQFDIASIKIFTEYYTSKITIDGETGGRIDILLEDRNLNRIIIENKIYAADQNKQLIRYNNFDKNAKLLYLSLFGTKPTAESAKELEYDIDYQVISYKENILNWLEECYKESISQAVIRETIFQYINLIKRLTNQSTSKEMSDSIKDIFLANPDYFDSFKEITKAYNELKDGIYKKFFNILHEKMTSIGLENPIENTPYKIQLQAQEDTSGFIFIYRIIDRDWSFRCNIWDKLKGGKIVNPMVSKEKNPAIYERYGNKIVKIVDWAKESSYSLGYYNPKKFMGGKHLNEISTGFFLSLWDEKICSDFIDELLLVENENFKKIMKELFEN